MSAWSTEGTVVARVGLPNARCVMLPPWTERSDMGEVVPMPTLLAKYALPVVVAPPLIVSPVVAVPPPMVEEAFVRTLDTLKIAVVLLNVNVEEPPKRLPSLYCTCVSLPPGVVDAFGIHTLFTEKNPLVKLTPFAKVELAVVDFIFKIPSTDNPPANVEVPCLTPTVMAAAKVEVAVVEVAKIELKNPWEAESCVVEAIGNVLTPVAVEVIAPAIASVEVAVIAPPKKEVPDK